MGIATSTYNTYHVKPLPNDLILHDLTYNITGDATGGGIEISHIIKANRKSDRHVLIRKISFQTNDLSITNSIGNRQGYPYWYIDSTLWTGLEGNTYLSNPLVLEESSIGYLEVPQHLRNINTYLGKMIGPGQSTIYFIFTSNTNNKTYKVNFQYISGKYDFEGLYPS